MKACYITEVVVIEIRTIIGSWHDMSCISHIIHLVEILAFGTGNERQKVTKKNVMLLSFVKTKIWILIIQILKEITLEEINRHQSVDADFVHKIGIICQ
jgi:hypothetical protein